MLVIFGDGDLQFIFKIELKYDFRFHSNTNYSKSIVIIFALQNISGCLFR